MRVPSDESRTLASDRKLFVRGSGGPSTRPVDVLSRIIVHLSSRPESMGKAFNLVNPGRLPWPRLFDIIRSLGYSVQAIPYREWLDALRTSSSSAISDKARPSTRARPWVLVRINGYRASGASPV